MIKLFFLWLKNVLHKPSKYAGLRRFSIFKQLSSFELYLLNNFLHHRSFKSGEILFDKDYPLEMIYFIEKGEIALQGKSHPKGYQVLKKNDSLGIMDMYFDNVRSSTAKALSEVSVLAISRYDLLDLIHHNPHIGVKILSGICQAFSHYIFQISSECLEKEEAAAAIVISPDKQIDIDAPLSSPNPQNDSFPHGI